MRKKKTAYNPDDNSLSREKLANPFPNDSINDRLIKSNSKNLVNNHIWKDLGNGYLKAVVIDENKLL